MMETMFSVRVVTDLTNKRLALGILTNERPGLMMGTNPILIRHNHTK